MTTTLSLQIRSTLWAPRLLLADICRLQNAKGSVGEYECLKSYPKYRKGKKKLLPQAFQACAGENLHGN